MPVLTIRGIVKDGEIPLTEEVSLPEDTPVLVVVPDIARSTPYLIVSPHLLDPEDAPLFEIEVIEDDAAI